MKLKYTSMPTLRPLPIPTKGKGFFSAIWLWIMTTRKWVVVKDWNYELDGIKYRVPKDFIFDGASVPKYFRSWLSPMGVLLIAGLIHDYGYKYAGLLLSNSILISKSQKQMDTIFREVAIADNGFKMINYIAYYALRIGGWWAWKGHRKADYEH
jgi:hypothetical protein